MTQVISNSYPTKFGKFAACDRETYRKLKAIRRYYEFAQAWASRWCRAQGRLPKNRIFSLRTPQGKRRFMCQDSWVFPQFWTICEGSRTTNWRGQTVVAPKYLKATPLLDLFLTDYRNARTPKDKAEDVKPLVLLPEEIDQLLADIQKWHESMLNQECLPGSSQKAA